LRALGDALIDDFNVPVRVRGMFSHNQTK